MKDTIFFFFNFCRLPKKENPLSEAFDPLIRLRSPRERLGGYAILPRLIDKVRLHHLGILPDEYCQKLLSSDQSAALDGCFLKFAGIDPESLRKTILSVSEDQEVADWVERNALFHTQTEKEAWETELVRRFSDPTPERIAIRSRLYPELAEKLGAKTLGALDPFKMIDLDEGRISIGSL